MQLASYLKGGMGPLMWMMHVYANQKPNDDDDDDDISYMGDLTYICSK